MCIYTHSAIIIPHVILFDMFNCHIYIFDSKYIYFCFPEVNECTATSCMHGGTCIDEFNGFKCACAAGYTDPICATGKEVLYFLKKKKKKNYASCRHTMKKIYLKTIVLHFRDEKNIH